MTGIVWLASYPKSGNTWFRIFLTNYLRDPEAPIDINDLEHNTIASGRALLDEALGIESGELAQEEIELLRPELYLKLAQQPGLLLCKVHDAYTYLPNGQALFPARATRAAIYLVRNPLDVCVSFTHHNGHANHHLTARQMADDENSMSTRTDRQHLQLAQRLMSWSNHVRGWLEAENIRIHVVRYEDMHLAPEATFGAALATLDIERDSARMRRALAFSSFAELERQERSKGFRERYPKAKSFFRKGKIGAWRETLPAELAQSMIEQHAPMMRRLGYLNESGLPVF